MNNQLVRIRKPQGQPVKRPSPIPAIIFWVGLAVLAIAFFPYLSLNTNRALQKQDREHKEALAELDREIANLRRSLAEITKPAPEQDKKVQKKETLKNCSLSAQTYQNRYMAKGNISDFVCLDKALKRELGVR